MHVIISAYLLSGWSSRLLVTAFAPHRHMTPWDACCLSILYYNIRITYASRLGTSRRRKWIGNRPVGRSPSEPLIIHSLKFWKFLEVTAYYFPIKSDEILMYHVGIKNTKTRSQTLFMSDAPTKRNPTCLRTASTTLFFAMLFQKNRLQSRQLSWQSVAGGLFRRCGRIVSPLL